jgi:hypothetical protein
MKSKIFFVAFVALLFASIPYLMGGHYQGGLDINKIDDATTLGLAGVNNSAAYRIMEIEKHHHSPGYWAGISGDQSGNDWNADTLNPFVAISGAGDYGGDASDEAKIIGTADACHGSNVKFDIHYILISDVDHDTPYKLRVVWDTSDMATGIAAGNVSEVMVMVDTSNPAQSAGAPFPIQMPRLNCATDKVWIQAKNATDNSEIDFFIGWHEYAG